MISVSFRCSDGTYYDLSMLNQVCYFVLSHAIMIIANGYLSYQFDLAQTAC